MVFDYKKFVLDSFTGGITDDFVGADDQGRYEVADNLIITEQGNLKVREGYKFYYTTDLASPIQGLGLAFDQVKTIEDHLSYALSNQIKVVDQDLLPTSEHDAPTLGTALLTQFSSTSDTDTRYNYTKWKKFSLISTTSVGNERDRARVLFKGNNVERVPMPDEGFVTKEIGIPMADQNSMFVHYTRNSNVSPYVKTGTITDGSQVIQYLDVNTIKDELTIPENLSLIRFAYKLEYTYFSNGVEYKDISRPFISNSIYFYNDNTQVFALDRPVFDIFGGQGQIYIARMEENNTSFSASGAAQEKKVHSYDYENIKIIPYRTKANGTVFYKDETTKGLPVYGHNKLFGLPSGQPRIDYYPDDTATQIPSDEIPEKKKLIMFPDSSKPLVPGAHDNFDSSLAGGSAGDFVIVSPETQQASINTTIGGFNVTLYDGDAITLTEDIAGNITPADVTAKRVVVSRLAYFALPMAQGDEFLSPDILDRSLDNTINIPRAKFYEAINGTIWSFNVLDESVAHNVELMENRVHQGAPGTLSSAIDAAFIDLDRDIVGASQVKGIPLAFTDGPIFRIEGKLNLDYSGSLLRAKTISDDAGCISNDSIVTTESVVYFWGKQAIYATDGFSVKPISSHLTSSYKQILDNGNGANVEGSYDERNRLIKWHFKKNGSTYNDDCIILNLYTGGFTKENGDTYASIHTLFFGSSMLRTDFFGHLYIQDRDSRGDVYYNENNFGAPDVPANWRIQHIPFKFASAGFHFGNKQWRKWIKGIELVIRVFKDLAIRIGSKNNDSSAYKYTQEIKELGTDNGTVIRQRRFPRGHARCRYKQFSIEPYEVVAFKSDDSEAGDITDLGATFSMVKATNFDDTVIPNFKIAFETDGYATKYNIDTRDNTTLFCTGSVATALGVKWQIYGKPAEQDIEIRSVAMDVSLMDNAENKFQSTETGGNA